MPKFDIDAYLAAKASLLSSQDKVAELVVTARNKTEQMIAQREAEERAVAAQIQARRDAYTNSWVGKIGLEPESIPANIVNFGASAASGVSRLVGDIAAVPSNAANQALLREASAREIEAWNRTKTGQATPEDTAVLARQVAVNGPTVAQRLEMAEKHRNVVGKIDNAFNYESIVDPTNRESLAKDLAKDFDKNWGKLTQGNLGEKFSGAAALLVNAVGSIGGNLAGTLEYASENVPQVAVGLLGKAGRALLTASNLGYAGDHFTKGVQNYAKENNGQLPPKDQLDYMAKMAVMLAASEHFADVGMLKAGFGKVAGKVAGKEGAEAGVEAATDAVKERFKSSILGATAKGFVAEAPTEGFQTWAEGEVTGEKVTPLDIYSGTVIGGASGATLAGGMRTLAGLGDPATQEKLGQAKEALKNLNKPPVNAPADLAKMADPTSRNYAPDQAISTLFTQSAAADATPETVAANFAQAEQILAKLEDVREIKARELAAAVNGPDQLQQQINELKAMNDPAVAEEISLMEEELAELKANPPLPATLKKMQDQLAALDTKLASARDALTKFSLEKDRKHSADPAQAVKEDISQVTKNPSAPEAASAAERIVSLAMESPEMLPPSAAKKLAEDRNNNLTEAQRDFLRRFSAARTADNMLKSMGKVGDEILNGTQHGATRNKGLLQYRQRIAQALKAGNQKAVERELEGMHKFLASHASKAKVAAELWNGGSGRGTQMVRLKDSPTWVKSPKQYDLKDARQLEEFRSLGGLELMSGRLVGNIQSEANAIATAVAEMQAAINVKFPSAQGGSRGKNTSSSQGTSGQAQSGSTATPDSQTPPKAAEPAAGTAATGTSTRTGTVVTWDTLDTLQLDDNVTLYRGESDKNAKGGEWWTTDRNYAAKFGTVTAVTLPVRLIAKHALRGHAGKTEFIFPDAGKRPPELRAELDKPAAQAKKAQNSTEDKPAKEVKLSKEFQAIKDFLDALGPDGVALNPVKLRVLGEDIGLEIAKSAKPEATLQRLRDALAREIERLSQPEADTPKKDPLERYRVLLDSGQMELRNGILYLKSEENLPKALQSMASKLAFTDIDNHIVVNLPAARREVKDGFPYISGKVDSVTSEQKQKVAEVLGWTPETLKQMFPNPKAFVQFLGEHERSHIENNDRQNYPRHANGKLDLMHPKAIEIEVRASRDALATLGIKPVAAKPAQQEEVNPITEALVTGLANQPINIWYSSGQNASLSNLADRPFHDSEGNWFYSVEHAYQSWKSGTLDKVLRNRYDKAGQKIPGNKGTKTAGGWNIQMMKKMMLDSFIQNRPALDALLKTGNAPFTHKGGRDQFWEAKFPELLAEVRQELRERETDPINNDPLVAAFNTAFEAYAANTKDKKAEAALIAAHDAIDEAVDMSAIKDAAVADKIGNQWEALLDEEGTFFLARAYDFIPVYKAYKEAVAAQNAKLQSTQGTSGASVDTTVVATQTTAATTASTADVTVEKQSNAESTTTAANSTPSVETPAASVQNDQSAEGNMAAPTLTVFATAEAAPAGTKPTFIYTQYNRVKAWLKQRKAPAITTVNGSTVRPLVAVKNLLTQWNNGTFSPADLFPKNEDGTAFTPNEQKALETFQEFANKWADTVRQGFASDQSRDPANPNKTTPRVNPRFSYRDPIQDFIQAGKDDQGNVTTQVDENIVTAVLYGMYSWLNDASFSTMKSPEDILKMHGLREEDGMAIEGIKFLRDVEALEDTAINSMGGFVWDALGLQVDPANPDIPQDYKPKVIAAFGVHVMMNLQEAGLLQRASVPGEKMQSWMPALNVTPVNWYTDKKTGEKKPIYPSYTYVKVVRDWNPETRQNDYPEDTQKIRDASVKSRMVIDRLFGADKVPVMASWKPIPFQQDTAKRTDQKVPAFLRQVLEKSQPVPHRVIQDMWFAVQVLGRDHVLKAAGYVDLNTVKVHEDDRKAIETQNANLANQLDLAMALVEDAQSDSPHGLNQDFFINHEVWRNLRVGITTRNLNPQSSKIHRALFARPQWASTIALDNDQQLDLFYIALAQALGTKIDSQMYAKTLAEFKAKLAEPDNRTMEMALALHRSRNNPALMDEALRADIAAFAAKEEGMQTLQALVAYGKLLDAMATGQKEVTITMLVGVDGKTNGPMLSMLALGAGVSANDLYINLNQGGFYRLRDGVTNFNQWYEDPKHLDLYEGLAKYMLSGLEQDVPPDVLESLEAFTKKLIDGDNVTSAGRKITKTPLTAFNFGSSPLKAAESMARSFLGSVREAITATANNDPKALSREDLIKHLNRLLQAGGALPDAKELYPEDATFDDLLQPLGRGRKEFLTNSFMYISGRVEESLNNYFAVMIERRDNVNRTLRSSFQIYNAVYQDMRAKEIARLVEAGEIQSIKDGHVHDLTQAQEDALLEKVLALLPRAHTTYTAGTNELDSGMLMAKTMVKAAHNYAYQAKVQTGHLYDSSDSYKVSHVYTYALQMLEKDVGVGGLAYLIHSLDSGIMHESIEDTQTLNVHDEGSNSLNRVVETAQRLNHATWNRVLHFSPAAEAFNLLERTLRAASDLLSQHELSPEAAQALLDSLRQQLPPLMRKKTSVRAIPSLLLTLARTNQHQADLVRLEALAQMTAVDQYTWEGGQYDVTEKDRAEAQALLTAERAKGTRLSPELSKLAAELGAKLEKIASGKDTADSANTTAAPEAETKVTNAGLRATGLRGLPLLLAAINSMGKVDSPADLIAVVNAVKSGTSLDDAINDMRDLDTRSRLVQAITRLGNELSPETLNPWGPTGGARYPEMNEPEVETLLRQTPRTTGAAMIAQLQTLLKGQDTTKAKLYLWLLARLAKSAAKDIEIHYITPDTPYDKEAGGLGKARGWYSPTGRKIYIKSSDFRHGAVAAELLIHEMIHAALLKAAKNTANPQVAELTRLYHEVKKYADTHGFAAEHRSQLANLDEFIAWGLSSRKFQDWLASIQVGPNYGQAKNMMQRFMSAVLDILFPGANKRQAELGQNALAVLLANATAMFDQVAQAGPDPDNWVPPWETAPGPDNNPSGNFPMASPDPVGQFTTQEIYQALTPATGIAHPGFDAQLRNLLDGIVAKLHGPFGSFRAEMANLRAANPLDAWLKARDTGLAPFGSQVLASGFPVTQQEAFVLEQVEATVKASLATDEAATRTAYKQLSKVYDEAYAKFSEARHFHDGDWATATVEEQRRATALRDFVFKIDKNRGDRSDYLARFAALTLAHPRFAQMMQTPTTVGTTGPAKSFAERVQAIFEKILEFFQRKITGTYAGQEARAKVAALVSQLVDIEEKSRNTLRQRDTETYIMAPLEKAAQLAADTAREKVVAAARSNVVKNSSNAFVRFGGAMAETYVGERVEAFMGAALAVRDRHLKSSHGVLASLFAELKGPAQFVHNLIRAAKIREGERKDQIAQASSAVLAAFANGKGLSAKAKAALSAVFLRTGAHYLLGQVTMAELEQLLSDPAQLDAKIGSLESQIDRLYGRYGDLVKTQAQTLGLYKATGQVHGFLYQNTHLMAAQSNLPHAGRITAAQRDAAQPILAQLVALYAMAYTDSVDRREAIEVLRAENNRGRENGVEFMLKLTKRLEDEARDKLFDGNPALMVHGYTPEIYDPYIEVMPATAEEGRELELQGWVRGSKLSTDPIDVSGDTRFLYVRRGGGMPRRESGAMSLTNDHSMGSTVHSGYLNVNSHVGAMNASLQAQLTNAALQRMGAQINRRSWKDFPQQANAAPTQLAPVFNAKGEVVNWRYLMTEDTKDTLLNRDNRFEQLIGVAAGQLFDKITTPEQNKQVVQALREQFDAEGAAQPDAYVLIGEASSDSELRDLWRLLPDKTKADVRRIWGYNGLQVRKDSVHILFGYRKKTIAAAFAKTAQERGLLDLILVRTAELMFGKKMAALRVRQIERAWQEIAAEIKDLIVVKSGIVMLGNIKSNFTLLMLQGVPVKTMLKHHLVALRGATAYQKDSSALARLKLARDAQYLTGAALTEAEREIARLEDAIARNPVKELIDAGLMPTIVEDLAQDEDIYSYKSHLTRWVDAKTGFVPAGVKSAARVVYMAHDTKLYQGLSRITQLSDFVARYTLYQHLTTRKDKPLSKAEAIQQASDAFINYDIPLHPTLQYLDDMGILPFMKYFLRIQRVLFKTMKENPGRVVLMALLGNLMDIGETVLDSSIFARLGNNPLTAGALRLPSTLDDLATINASMAVFK